MRSGARAINSASISSLMALYLPKSGTLRLASRMNVSPFSALIFPASTALSTARWNSGIFSSLFKAR